MKHSINSRKRVDPTPRAEARPEALLPSSFSSKFCSSEGLSCVTSLTASGAAPNTCFRAWHAACLCLGSQGFAESIVRGTGNIWKRVEGCVRVGKCKGRLGRTSCRSTTGRAGGNMQTKQGVVGILATATGYAGCCKVAGSNQLVRHETNAKQSFSLNHEYRGLNNLNRVWGPIILQLY